VIRAHKTGKITKKEASKAIADLVEGVLDDAIERIHEEEATEQAADRQGVDSTS
jgi:hypothetical protein